MSTPFQSWQVDFIRGKVDEMKGELNVRIYRANATYRIWYNPNDDVALIGKVVWDEQHQRERLTKAWPNEVLETLNRKGTRIHVQYRNSEKKSQWFGPNRNMLPIEQAYEYIASFIRHDDDHVCLEK